MPNPAKKLKPTTKLTWTAILADEYLVEKFNLKTFVKADVTNNQLLSKIIAQLTDLYPISDYRYKRVRKVQDKFEILLTEKEKFTQLTGDLASQLVNVSEIELPTDRVLTRRQFDAVSKQFWPLSFHLNKYLESLIDRTFFNGVTGDRCDEYARLALRLAAFNKAKSAAIIVDPRTDMYIYGFSQLVL